MKKHQCGTRWALLAVLGVFAWCPLCAHAGFTYNEVVDGDLPHPDSAFVLPFGAPNPNRIALTVDLSSDGWILTVDPGESLKSFTLTSFTPGDPAYSATFHMYDGPTPSDPVLGTAFASFDADFAGLDFLEHFGIGPLGPGQYLFNFWHDNTPGPTTTFYMNFTGESPVEPGTWGAIKSLYR